MITSRMLPRQLTLPPHPPAKLTPSLSYSCGLLCAPPKVNSHQISNFQPLFAKHPGWGYPSEDVRCTEAQKCPSVSPLFATLTHSVSRKSFACHSYANTRDGVSRLLQFPAQCWQLQFCSHVVFIAIQIPFPANPFFSHPSKSLGVSPLRPPCSDLGGFCVKPSALLAGGFN